MSTGPRGLQGLQGPIGPPGVSGASNIFAGTLTDIPLTIESNDPLSLTVIFADGTNFDGTLFRAPTDGIYFAEASASILPIGLIAPTYIRLEFFINRGIPGGPDFGGIDLYYDPVIIGDNPIKINTSSYFILREGETISVNILNLAEVQMQLFRAFFAGQRVDDLPAAG